MQSGVGTIGHGIYETDEAGRQLIVTTPDCIYECRLQNEKEAREFLKLRAYLGTSRLAVRRQMLEKVVPLPVEFGVEADEFLTAVTIAYAGGRVLSDPLTNYRLHSGNMFQYGNGDPVRARRKYIALAGIVRDLPARLVAAGISAEVADILTSSVHLDAQRLILSFRVGCAWGPAPLDPQSPPPPSLHTTFRYLL